MRSPPAHQKQITHRDLKPGNVMVSSEGRVKVLDFGLARVGGANAGEQTLIATQAPITHQGTIVGTMPYMSPEQVEGRHLDARSDLFSLGVIFYELLNGGRPFQGSSSPALMSAILRDTPSSVCEKRPDVPEAIDRLISRLLEKRPEDRVQTARDVYNELRHVQRTSDARSSSVQRTAAPSAAQNLWIAVLPFTTRGTNADAEAMAAGLTDDITTSLAKFSGLSVVAAQSTRAFKDSPLDVRQIAERIGARYMASGSVRQSGSAFRVSAQLIDAQSGAQLWSETYDRRLENSDLFTIQDDLTDRIVATLADESGVLARSMARSIGQTSIDDPNEQQLIVQMWGFQHDPTPPRHEELRATIERQVELHPNSAEAWADLANLYVVEHALLFNPRPDPLGRALRAARRAVEIDRGCQKGWLWLGITHFHLHDRRGLDEAFERASAINPRNANAMGWMGNMLAHAGDYDRGSALSERAMQINPGHPGWLHFVVFTRQFAHGAFEEALQAARRVNIPNFFWMHFAIAAACGQLGRAEEGKAAYDAMVRIAPALGDGANLREFVSRWYWSEEMIESLLDGVQRSSERSSTVPSDARHKPPSAPSGVPRTSSSTQSTPQSESTSLRAGDASIAVLPFADLSEKKDQDWFCDGIAEEIMNALSGLPGLRVAPRTSAFSFRGRADDLEAIGERLNVNTVLEGSVRRAGDRVRITTRLSDAQLGRQLWSERFDRELKDIFDVQDEIARAVADRLRVTIAGAGVRLVQKATTNIAAYELMLKGRVFLNRRGPAIANAIPCFEQAIALDPKPRRRARRTRRCLPAVRHLRADADA
jgi:TolB-like protein